MSAAQELTGKYAQVKIGGVTLMDAYEVTVEISNTFLEPRPFGRSWKKRIPDEADFSVTAKRYSIPSSIAAVLDLAASTPSAGDNRTPATIVVYQDEHDTSTRIFEGPIWVEKGTLSMPAGLVDEDISFVAADDPVYIAGRSI
ncbi:MAG: hypothetical protein ABFD83_14785 [Armatimonadota bacterium]